MAQLHKKFTNEQVKDLMNRYSRGEIKREHVQTILNIGKSRFFSLLNLYRKDPIAFSIAYKRTKATRIIAKPIEQNIIKELVVAKKFIDNKDMPIWSYNYSFIKNDLENRYRQQVSVPTIIAKAKKYGFYISKPEKKKAHDREVITNNVGELIQHDSSLHLWSPYASCKWWLITSIDDFSRFLLFALLVFRDISIAHIRALQTVFLKYGVPLSFYVDCDSIFKFIRGRDELHYKHLLQTDETMPQWKQVCFDCQVKVINALSPQAKGKVERPYGWIQDHLVRICARENVTTIAQANQILQREVNIPRHEWRGFLLPLKKLQLFRRMSNTLVVMFEVSFDDLIAYLISHAPDCVAVFPKFSSPEKPFLRWKYFEHLSRGYSFDDACYICRGVSRRRL